jgi:D-serine deaminase-like pyridoxal phosphate-dependent protein
MLVEAIAGERLPCAVVDLDAVDRNVDRIRALLRGKTCRVASKSIRHVGLLRRILERGGPDFAGLMCFTAEEAVHLADEGFTDLLVAYPTLQVPALTALAGRGSIIVDCQQHVEAASQAGRAAGTPLDVLLELDVSYRRGPIHLGARRSPIRGPEAAIALARSIQQTEGVNLLGLMGYEGHVAGVPDASPFAPAMNPLKRAMKRVAQPEVARLRAATVAALRAEGFDLTVVNGGGTGSLHLTATEDCVTEVTAGSGFVCSHLFSAFADLDLEPAAWFACEAVRRSDPDMVTCLGGGYVASGEPGWDKVPLPVEPPGLKLTPLEATGEVQTPLTGGGAVELGQPVLFRHAKAGELAERFNTYLLVREGRIVAREPTYRGQGQCFL